MRVVCIGLGVGCCESCAYINTHINTYTYYMICVCVE